MVNVSNVSDFSMSSDYEWFAATPITGDVTVSVYSSDGYVEYPYCDVFVSDNASLVCFKKPDVQIPNKHDFYVSNGNESFLVQSLNYENARDIVSGEKSYPYSIYLYLNSINVTPEGIASTGVSDVDHYHESKTIDRCDTESWGPISFYDVTSGYQLEKLRIVLSVTGVAHILRFDMNDTEIKNGTSRAGNTAARSLRGIIKTINEWGMCVGAPFNNTELPALKASSFLQESGISPEILEDVISDSPDMRVVQYLTNNTIPYEEFEENHSVPDSLKQHMLSVFRYKTVSAVVKNNPYGLSLEIPQSVIDNEKTEIETIIYSFLTENGINLEAFDANNAVSIAKTIVNRDSGISKRNFIESCEAYLGYQ